MIRRRNIDPNAMFVAQSLNTAYVSMPATNAIGLRTAAAITALGNQTLDGAAVTLFQNYYYLPMPAMLLATTGIAATTFTATVTGLDYQGNERTATVTKSATGVTTQYANDGIVWLAILSINITATSNLADTLSWGWGYRAGTTSQGALRIPCFVPSTSSDIVHVSLVDAGGGTFGQTKWIAAGSSGTTLLGFTTSTGQGPTLAISNPDCTVQPTSPITFAIMFQRYAISNALGASSPF